MSPSTATAALKDFAPAAASLFNNMKTPASILAGAIVPLGFLSPLPQPPENIKASISTNNNNKKGKGGPKSANLATLKSLDRMLRKSYLLVTIFSFGSELLAVMWATVAVNQLTETVVEPAESVWALLKRDWFDLAWAATNSHFVLGMLGFMWMVGTRAYLTVQAKPWNVNAVTASGESSSSCSPCTMSLASLSMVLASLLLMVSIVNRGVANGGGQPNESYYGGSVLSLVSHYLTLLFQQATGIAVSSLGPLEISSLVFAAASLLFGVKAVFMEP